MPDQIMLQIQSHNVHNTLYNVARSDMIYTVGGGGGESIAVLANTAYIPSELGTQSTIISENTKKPSVITHQKKTGRLKRA